MELTINATYQSLLPPLAPEELAALEESIQRDGVLYPIVATSTGVIIDGHNRYAIATRLGLPYEVTVVEFADHDELLLWILRHQVGRRNLDQQLRKLFIGRLYNATKKDKLESLVPGPKPHKTAEIRRGATVAPRSNGTARTRDKVSSSVGVSPRTVDHHSAFAANVDSLVDPVQQAISTGRLKVTDSQVEALAELPSEKQLEIAGQVAEGKPLRVALKEVQDAPEPEPDDLPWAEVHREMTEIGTRIKQTIDEVLTIAGGDYGEALAENSMTIKYELMNARQSLMASRPYGECPYCLNGSVIVECQACKGKNWLTKSSYNAAPDKAKARHV